MTSMAFSKNLNIRHRLPNQNVWGKYIASAKHSETDDVYCTVMDKSRSKLRTPFSGSWQNYLRHNLIIADLIRFAIKKTLKAERLFFMTTSTFTSWQNIRQYQHSKGLRPRFQPILNQIYFHLWL